MDFYTNFADAPIHTVLRDARLPIALVHDNEHCYLAHRYPMKTFLFDDVEQIHKVLIG